MVLIVDKIQSAQANIMKYVCGLSKGSHHSNLLQGINYPLTTLCQFLRDTHKHRESERVEVREHVRSHAHKQGEGWGKGVKIKR